jgi:predicted negative regulator of RcsB-dependent stress response
LEEILANDTAQDDKPATMTAGERLAAQQAAKAAKKAAKKGRDAELVEEKALEQAAAAKDWLQDNLKPIGLMAGGVLLVAAIGIGWSTLQKGQTVSAGSALAAVMESDSDDPAAAAIAYAEVAELHPGTPAAAWARVGEGRALYAQGEFAKSIAAYEAALEGSEDESLQWAALEGLAYALEAESSYEAALDRLEALGDVGASYAPIAGYHRGRILQAQGQLDEAKTAYEGVLADLKDSGAPSLPFTQEQTQARLAVLAPALTADAGQDPRQTQELMRRMNELLQRQPPEE